MKIDCWFRIMYQKNSVGFLFIWDPSQTHRLEFLFLFYCFILRLSSFLLHGSHEFISAFTTQELACSVIGPEKRLIVRLQEVKRAETRRWCFSFVASTLWNTLASKIKLFPCLIAFRKMHKLSPFGKCLPFKISLCFI